MLVGGLNMPKIGQKLSLKAKMWPIIKKEGGYFRQKIQSGAELKNKKWTLWAKIDQFWKEKKKRHFRPQKLAGAELKNKKSTFLGKNCEKIECKGQKLTNIKKKDFLGPKTSWGRA